MNFKTKNSNKWLLTNITLFSFLIDKLPIDEENLDIKIIRNFSDVKKILKLEKIDKFKYIYFDKKTIHQILYEFDNFISINEEYISSFKEFENLFYVDLLILSEPYIMNYEFSKQFVLKIDKLINNIYKNKLSLTILCKIKIDFINNYKLSDVFNESNDEDELNDIENNCKNLIKENVSEFEKIGVTFEENEIYSLKVDEIYSATLKALIESNKFQDYEYIYRIVNDLNLEKIFITKTMFDELNKALNLDKDYIKPYIIIKIENLFDIRIINFYYILIKYIFKNSFYLYQIPLLLNTRNIIIYIIKKNLDNLIYCKLKYEKDIVLMERVDYVMEKILDSEFHYKKYIQHFRKNKLKSIKFFYKFFFFDTHKKLIKELENITENDLEDKYNHIASNNKIMENIEIRLNVINHINPKPINIGDLFLNQNKIKRIFESWKLIEKIIKEKKLKRMSKLARSKLYNLLQNTNTLKMLKKIFTEKEINFFLNHTENLPKINLNKEANDSKLIAVGMDTVNIHLDNEMKNSSIMIQTDIISENSKSIIKSDSKFNPGSIYKYVEESFVPLSTMDKFKKSHHYKIIEHCDIMGKHKSAEFIKQLSNGGFMSGGDDRNLIWYDKLFRQIEIIFIKEYQVNLYEIVQNNNEEEINIISLSDNKINFINLNPKNKETKIEGKISNPSIISVLNINSEFSLILATDKIGRFKNKWDKYTCNIEKISNISNFYKGGILLKNEIQKIFVLTSTDIIPNGINQMIFYNYSKNEIIGKIDGYSFVPSYNNLCEINQTIILNQKLLLAACTKKEKDENKNGILVINLKLNGKVDYNIYFHETKNFEVSCFCQILNVSNNNSIYDNISNKNLINITDTKYILIGGFDKDKREGCIKLFKIESNFMEKFEIKFMQDILVEQSEIFKGFNAKISSIIQSKITGNILITCWDGNVHLFKPPNIDYYENK